MPSYTVADYLIARLQQVGLKHLFAVPGDYASSFLLALDATPGIERIPNINELGSGYAADGYARFQGIGAACVQYGVGTFSMLNCVAGSYVERLPIVVISASPSTKSRVLERTEDILFHHSTGNLRSDQIVMRQVTVASEIVSDPAKAPAQIDRAFVEMLTHHRPIYIEVLQNVWTLECAPPQGALTARPVTSNAAALEAAVDAAFLDDHREAVRAPGCLPEIGLARLEVEELALGTFGIDLIVVRNEAPRDDAGRVAALLDRHAAVVGDDGGLHAKLVRRAGLAEIGASGASALPDKCCRGWLVATNRRRLQQLENSATATEQRS